jgi:hypothetical protein
MIEIFFSMRYLEKVAGALDVAKKDFRNFETG